MNKYISYALALFALGFTTACEPLDDLYKELDQEAKPVTKKTEIILTSSDYTTIAAAYENKIKGGDKDKKLTSEESRNKNDVTNNQAVTKVITAEEYIPVVLSKRYPEWGKGSLVNVTYNELLPRDSKTSLGKSAFIEVQLKDLGITSLSELKDKAKREAVIAKAEELNVNKASVLFIKATLSKTEAELLYTKGGKELNEKGFHYLSWADYQEMGLSYGNFSSSAKENDYLPTFLNKHYPYAKEGHSMYVAKLYYESKEKVYPGVFKYVFTNGHWVPAPTTTVKTAPFIHTGKVWMFDPTVFLTLESSDFALLHSWVSQNKPGYISKKYPTNEEYYFGGSGYYKNFNVDGGETVGAKPDDEGKSAEELKKEKYARILTALDMILVNRYGSNPAQLGGVDLYYNITVQIRDNYVNADWLYTFKGLGNGKFELQGQPVKK